MPRIQKILKLCMDTLSPRIESSLAQPEIYVSLLFKHLLRDSYNFHAAIRQNLLMGKYDKHHNYQQELRRMDELIILVGKHEGKVLHFSGLCWQGLSLEMSNPKLCISPCNTRSHWIFVPEDVQSTHTCILE